MVKIGRLHQCQVRNVKMNSKNPENAIRNDALFAFIPRSKRSYEDASGNAAIKIIPPRPSGASLRSRVEPAKGLVNRQVPTSPQCDIWRL